MVSQQFTNPTSSSGIVVTPNFASLSVGASRTFTGTASLLAAGSLTWAGSDVVSVTANGPTAIAKCLKTGTGTVTVTRIESGSDTGRATAQIDCTEPVRLTVSPANVTQSHVVGQTVCPQPLGTVVVTNISTLSVSVTAQSQSVAVEVRPALATLAPGVAQTFDVVFTCRTNPPVKTTILFTVTVEGVQMFYTVDVNVSAGS